MPRNSGPSSIFSNSFDSSSDILPVPITNRICMSAAVKRYRYLRKLMNFNHMDFEFACWQMLYLFINPQKVYRNFQYRKATKSQFARDDPAFLVLLSSCLCISSLCFTIILHLRIGAFFKLLLYFVFVDCIGSGVIIASVLWFLSNKFFVRPSCKGQDVEWGYSFDVHLNAFLPLLVITHIFQVLFYNVLIKPDRFLSRFFGNSIWFVAACYYLYITFLGYKNLQFLHHTQTFFFLLPMFMLFLFYFITIIIGWNFSLGIMDFYIHRIL